jgi:hypothetical protein
MLHDFAVAVATFITVMGSVLAHDAQQLSTTVGNLIHPAATSVNVATKPQAQPAAAATTQGIDPFHSEGSSAAQADGFVLGESSSTPGQALSTVVNNYITQSVIERAVQVPFSPVTLNDLTALEARIDAKFAALQNPAAYPEQVAAAGVPAPYGAPPSFSNAYRQFGWRHDSQRHHHRRFDQRHERLAIGLRHDDHGVAIYVIALLLVSSLLLSAIWFIHPLFALAYPNARHNFALERDLGTMDIWADRLVGKSSIRRKQLAYARARATVLSRSMGLQEFLCAPDACYHRRISFLCAPHQRISGNARGASNVLHL